MFGKFFWIAVFIPLCFFAEVTRFCLAQQQTNESTESQTETTPSPKTEEQDSTTNPAPNQPIKRPSLPTIEQFQVQSLKEQLPSDEILMLPKEEEGKSFLAAYLRENTGSPKGGILIIPAEGQHVNWPKAILTLRKKLPDAGWHTLAIMPIVSEPPSPPKRTFLPKGSVTLASDQQQGSTKPEATEQSEEKAKEKESSSADTKENDQTTDKLADNEKQPEDTNKPEETAPPPKASKETKQDHPTQTYDPIQDMYNRTSQGLAHFAKQGLLFQVLIGQGEGAHWALAFLAEQKPENVHALILLNPAPSQSLKATVPQLLEKTAVLTLDIYITQFPGPSPEAKERVAAAHRGKNYNYFQYHLPAVPGSQDTTNDWLLKRVKSWLKRRAKTTELSTKKKNKE
ncbi:DUF3530 family protein [Spartinivicinus ruber]|uniref:DUF3530 family protein n=1 Tax=Spartinivicinus ruber TaxID=2683272 RepID=UPI0013D23D15|nr:DUF3530 family protein [Spartinivicinus ruber]